MSLLGDEYGLSLGGGLQDLVVDGVDAVVDLPRLERLSGDGVQEQLGGCEEKDICVSLQHRVKTIEKNR